MQEPVKGTGIVQRLDAQTFDRIPKFSGSHYWVLPAVYHIVDPTADPKFLDLENLVFLPDIGCWYCERIWTPLAALSPCPGEPNP